MEHSFTYHAFISHVFEDKSDIADPLNHALRAAGFKIWYSGSDLRTGDDLDRKILGVIPTCKYAIIIISPDYLKSEWARKELNAITALENPSYNIILPIWHNLSQKEMRAALPALSDRFAVSSSQGMDQVIPKLISVLRKRRISGGKAPAKNRRTQPKHIVLDSGLNGNGIRIDGKSITAGSLVIKRR